MVGFEGITERFSLTTIILLGFVVTYTAVHLIQSTINHFRRSKIIRENGCKPPAKYPHKDPIGLDLFRANVGFLKEGTFLQSTINRFKTVGGGVNTYSSKMLGDTVLNTIEPENIKAILATKFKDFSLSPRRKAAFNPMFGHGIFTTDGKEWENSRALLRPNFVRSQVGDLATFDDHIMKLVARVPKDGSTVDLQTLFFSLTMDSATDFLFGQSTDILSDDGDHGRAEHFADAFSYVLERAGVQGRVGKLATLMPDKRYTEGVKFVHEYVSSYVQKAVEKQKLHAGLEKEKAEEDGKASRYIFLEELAKTGYPAKKIQDELLNILLAGRDTTASLLSHLFFILARRPDVYAKLRAEVLALDNSRPSFEQIKDMKYLKYCLNETLRLYPIVPNNNRVAVRDTVLPLGGGPDGKSPILVKKGQQVNYYTYVMQRRKDFYGPDADEFKPERWESYRPGWEYLPFNGGPRICIGQQFALTEASYTTIRLLQAFKAIEPREDREWIEGLTVTLAIRDGCKVGLTLA